MAKLYYLPKGIAGSVYLLKPDDTAPKDADWKPDGKFKISLRYPDEAGLGPLHDAIVEAARAKWPGIEFDAFQFPWKNIGEDTKHDHLKNTTIVTAKSKYSPEMVDAKKQKLPLPKVGKDGKIIPPAVQIWGGDVCRAAVTLYLYEQTTKVKEGKKLVDVTVQGCSLQLSAVQLIEKRSGTGGGSDGFDEEDGYEVSGDDPGADDADF